MSRIRSGLNLSAVILGVLGIADTLFLTRYSGGKDLGILLPSIVGVLLIGAVIFTGSNYYKKNKQLFIKLAKVILCMFIIWLVSFAILSANIIGAAISQKDKKADAVFILGAGLKGEKPTLVLLERLDYAFSYLSDNPDSIAIVSGGQGLGENITEAEAMQRYLIKNGIPSDRVIKEEKATSTYENMIYSKKLYQNIYKKKLNSIMIITSDFHMMRSKMLAKRAGLSAYGISSKTPWYIYPNVFLREYFAFFKSFIIDR
jgi:uncharacterized SAM-binding protein YcdF (DUF218 family)